VDCVILNDEEIEMLTAKPTLLSAARELVGMGPRVVVAKQGKYGAALITAEDSFWLPAFPLDAVADPTGAGDTFAGGFIGSIARALREDPAAPVDDTLLRTAMAHGSALASFNVEEFGTERVARLTPGEIAGRVAELKRITAFAA
jgi:sugar/nucleoside kinase (ribokinase family)